MELLKRVNTMERFLHQLGVKKIILKAMESDDLSDAVMVVLDILDKEGMMPPEKIFKSEKRSDLYRKEGNQAFRNKNLEEAMELYNKALLFAPESSRAMKLAYSNRSALLHRKQLFSACLIDIERCLSMGCPDDILDKLKNRKKDCQSKKPIQERNLQLFIYSECLEKYLNLDKQRNPQIPCASAAVGVTMNDGIPKVIATKDIDVGAVMAVETAYVSENTLRNYFTACYYCHNLNLNLIPCDNCCVALFCGEDCKSRCKAEYHDVECQIIEVVLSVKTKTKLALKSVLKMKKSYQSWDEFVIASNKLGRQRIQDSSAGDIYDRNYPCSLLNCDDDKYFRYGYMYNQILMVTDILIQLRKVKSFFPNNDKNKLLAIRSLARTMMFLVLFCIPQYNVPVTGNIKAETTGLHRFGYLGYFSFLGKLNHCCNPNILMAALRNEVALIAARPVKRGTELTVSKLNHWLECSVHKERRQKCLFKGYDILCECEICTGWKDDTHNNTLSKAQKKGLKHIDFNKITMELNIPIAADKYFSDICKALAIVCNTPGSQEYEDIFTLFRRSICHFQMNKTKNVLLGRTNTEFSI